MKGVGLTGLSGVQPAQFGGPKGLSNRDRCAGRVGWLEGCDLAQPRCEHCETSPSLWNAEERTLHLVIHDMVVHGRKEGDKLGKYLMACQLWDVFHCYDL